MSKDENKKKINEKNDSRQLRLTRQTYDSIHETEINS
jgi:hypothetical protein